MPGTRGCRARPCSSRWTGWWPSTGPPCCPRSSRRTSPRWTRRSSQGPAATRSTHRPPRRRRRASGPSRPRTSTGSPSRCWRSSTRRAAPAPTRQSSRHWPSRSAGTTAAWSSRSGISWAASSRANGSSPPRRRSTRRFESDREAFGRHVDWVVNQGGYYRTTDTPRQAAITLRRLEDALAHYEADRAVEDPACMIRLPAGRRRDPRHGGLVSRDKGRGQRPRSRPRRDGASTALTR